MRFRCFQILPATLIALIMTSQAFAASPTTAPSIVEVKLTDAVPLQKLQAVDRETNLTDKLTKPQAEETTYFGEIDEFGDDDDTPDATLPIIALHLTETWTALPLGGDGLQNTGWKYVAAGPASHEIWGALDSVTSSTRTTFILAHSTDGGQTFQLLIFHKPCKLARFFDFAMSRNGHGRATVSLDADCGQHKAGLYHFETTDDGKTWSAEPKFEPDVMIRADEVPDEEQPDESATPHSASPTILKLQSNQMRRAKPIMVIHLAN